MAVSVHQKIAAETACQESRTVRSRARRTACVSCRTDPQARLRCSSHTDTGGLVKLDEYDWASIPPHETSQS